MIMLLIATAISLVSFANAVPNIVDMGPYKVYFNVGQHAGDYTVRIFPPDYSEILSGDKQTSYRFVLTNSITGDILEICVSAIDTPNALSAADRLSLKSIMNLVPEGFIYVNSADRVIDNNPGVVIEARSYNGKITEYIAVYTLTKENDTSITLISSWPWYPDTINMLNSIHVENVK